MIHFLEARDLVSLRALRPLDDVELNLIALFEALVALALDRTVMNEDIGPVIAAEESVPFCIVEPLNCSLVLCQDRAPCFSVRESNCVRKSIRLSLCDAKVAAGVFCGSFLSGPVLTNA